MSHGPSSHAAVRQTHDGTLLTIRVIPRASRSVLAGTRADALLVRLNAPPVDGAANSALIALLAEACDVPARSISILTGERGRLKTVKILGMSAAVAAERLGVGGTDRSAT